MKNKLKVSGAIVLLGAAFLSSCGSSDIDVEVVDTDSTATEIVETNELSIDYSVPTPNELFEIIKDNGGQLKSELFNSLDNKDKYVSTKAKALNFGTYSADLGYMSCFDHNIEFLKYTKVVENLGDDLGISEVFDQELMDRIENNEGQSDSLFMISNETYFDSYQFLEENEKGTELSLIIVGGYIESLFIVCNLVDTYSDDNKIVEKVGDQKLVLENILDFCMTYMDDEGVAEVMADLDELGQTFETNMTFVAGESSMTSEDGIVTLSGGGHFEMNEKAFNAIKEKVTEIRSKITQK
jgi:hypothetical protein